MELNGNIDDNEKDLVKNKYRQNNIIMDIKIKVLVNYYTWMRKMLKIHKMFNRLIFLVFIIFYLKINL